MKTSCLLFHCLLFLQLGQHSFLTRGGAEEYILRDAGQDTRPEMAHALFLAGKSQTAWRPHRPAHWWKLATVATVGAKQVWLEALKPSVYPLQVLMCVCDVPKYYVHLTSTPTKLLHNIVAE